MARRAFEVCGSRLDLDAISRAFEEAFGPRPGEPSVFDLGDTWAATLEAGGIEVSVRCAGFMGGCEVLVRSGDSPAVYCSKSCGPDPAARGVEGLERLIEASRRFVEAAGIPLIGSCGGASAE